MAGAPPLPARIPGLRVASSWEEVLAAIAREQASRRPLKAVVYACAPLQCLMSLDPRE